MTINTSSITAGFTALGLVTACTPPETQPLEPPYDITTLDDGRYAPVDHPGVTFTLSPYQIVCENGDNGRKVTGKDAIYGNQLDALHVVYIGKDGEKLTTSVGLDMAMEDLTETVIWACTEELHFPPLDPNDP